MAKLSIFRQDSRIIQEGEWVRVGEEYEDLEVRTRGFTDAYFDMLAARQRRAAAGFGGDTTKLPTAIRRAINVECLLAHVVLDVRNLQHDDGRDVNFDEFSAMLRDPDYAELVLACFRAAGQVGRQQAADMEEATGPLSKPSAGTSPGAATEA